MYSVFSVRLQTKSPTTGNWQNEVFIIIICMCCALFSFIMFRHTNESEVGVKCFYSVKSSGPSRVWTQVIGLKLLTWYHFYVNLFCTFCLLSAPSCCVCVRYLLYKRTLPGSKILKKIAVIESNIYSRMTFVVRSNF